MKENNKGSIIILTVIGIATLLVAVIGATFAFFTARIDYVNEPTQAVVESTSTMLIQFETKNSIVYKDVIPGRPTNSDANNKLVFTLTSDANLTSATAYNVYLVIDNNTFTDGEDGKGPNELVYLLEHSTKPSTVDGAIPSSAEIKNVNPQKIFLKYENDNIIESQELNVNSIDSTTGNESIVPEKKILIGSGVLGSHFTEDTWTMELWLQELQAEQNYNQSKTFEAHIEIEVTNNYLSNEAITKQAQ